MTNDDKAVYGESLRAHMYVYRKLAEIRVAARRAQDMKAATDSIYALKEASKLVDDLRKEINKLSDELQTMVCSLWVAHGIKSPIRTDYCTGSPDVKQVPKTPKSGTPEYEAFCKHYGVPADAPFSPHWTKLMETFSAAMEKGEPVPPGVDPSDVWTVFKVKTLKRRPIMDKDQAPPCSDPDLLRRVYDALETVDIGTMQAVLAEQHARDAEEHPMSSDDEIPF